MTDIKLDLTRIVSAILGDLTEPYKMFVAKLHAERRITDAEVSELRKAILERSDRLWDDDLQTQLQEDPGSEQK